MILAWLAIEGKLMRKQQRNEQVDEAERPQVKTLPDS